MEVELNNKQPEKLTRKEIIKKEPQKKDDFDDFFDEDDFDFDDDE